MWQLTIEDIFAEKKKKERKERKLKYVRLTFFKFSHVCFQNALEQITSWPFQEYELLSFLSFF